MSAPDTISVADFFAERARPVDTGAADVRDGLRYLGDRDLLALGAGSDGGADLVAAVELLESVAGECLSSAFALWAHRMVLEYLARAEDRGVAGRVAEPLRCGELTGATAMATALRDVAGLAPVPVSAEASGGGLRLRGRIPWASNLFPDAVVVLPVRLPEQGRAVVVTRVGTAGMTVERSPELLALNGTASSSVRLQDVRVPPDAVLSTDLRAFVDSFRRPFLLLQTAFCAGLARRCLTEARAASADTGSEFGADLSEQQASVGGLRKSLRELASDTRGTGAADFVRLRLAGARAAVAASRLEASVRGGAGYVAASGTSRRLREAAFLPIQAPTEGHLRWELSRSG
ncbi:acyl-CoA dehydrogenase family protein [Nocardia sp. BMG51109]|uniref:acyl-CoA dehydrogenase family protein n=1 Tax=Nocardia sp. BMG51109 TaxID=1056816 RepID=UPI000560A2F3|nr:acyl-CoA dehydrogenase family protein [Nocardia sp. BMG51109]